MPDRHSSDQPQAVLRFSLDRAAAENALARWAESHWFAPGKVRRLKGLDDLRPVFVPYRVFEAEAVARYRGRRGDHYWSERTRNDPRGTRSHEVRETTWRPVEGVVDRHFGGVVVCAATRPEAADRLDSWLLDKVVAHSPEAVEDLEVAAVDVDPDLGWIRAEERMGGVIREACAEDIGGDEQSVESVETELSDRMHTMALFPVWAGTYRHRGKDWPVVINGRSGQVEGDHPYSRVKIALLILALVLAAALSVEMFVVPPELRAPTP